MGDKATSGLDDAVIKDALWESYFDVEKALSWLYGVLSSPESLHTSYARHQTNKTRGLQQKSVKVGYPLSAVFRVVLLLLPSYIATSPRSKSHWWSRFRRKADDEQEGACRSIIILPSGRQKDNPYLLLSLLFLVPTNERDASYQYDSRGQPGGYPEDIERPRVPLIVLAQQGHYQPDYYPQEYVEYSPEMDFDDAPMGIMSRASRLSTITELTERTEPSRRLPSGQYNARGSLSTDTTSSYGRVISESAFFGLIIVLKIAQIVGQRALQICSVLHNFWIQMTYHLPHLLQRFSDYPSTIPPHQLLEQKQSPR